MSHGHSHGGANKHDCPPQSPRSKELYEAIRDDDYDTANRNIDQGQHVYTHDHLGRSPLVMLLKKDEAAGDLGKMTLARARLAMRMIRNGVEVNEQDSDGNTALHHAAGCSDDWTFLLIDAGANKEIKNRHKENPLEAAPSLAVDSLLRHTEPSSLRHAVRLGDPVAVQQELDSVGGRGNEEASEDVLLLACHFGHLDVLTRVMDANPPVNFVCEERPYAQRAPIHLAATEGHTNIVAWLLAHGADVNLAGSEGITALMLAARCGHEAVVRALIKAGADVNQEDEDGATALQYAQWRDHTDIQALLTAAGATAPAASTSPKKGKNTVEGSARDPEARARVAEAAAAAEAAGTSGSWCNVM